MSITSVSSSLTSSTSTVELPLVGAEKSGGFFSLSGTHSGFSVVFEGNLNDVWFPVSANRLPSGVSEHLTISLNTNATLSFYVSPGVFNKLRVRATARTSGTVVVNASSGPSEMSPVFSSHVHERENNGKLTAYVAAGTGADNVVVSATGPGVIHKIIVNTAGSTAGVILYDNATTNSGTILYTSPATHALGVYDINMTFANGITVRRASSTAEMLIVYSLN